MPTASSPASKSKPPYGPAPTPTAPTPSPSTSNASAPPPTTPASSSPCAASATASYHRHTSPAHHQTGQQPPAAGSHATGFQYGDRDNRTRHHRPGPPDPAATPTGPTEAIGQVTAASTGEPLPSGSIPDYRAPVTQMYRVPRPRRPVEIEPDRRG